MIIKVSKKEEASWFSKLASIESIEIDKKRILIQFLTSQTETISIDDIFEIMEFKLEKTDGGFKTLGASILAIKLATEEDLQKVISVILGVWDGER